MANLKPILDSTKISLEREASTRFGAAVEDFSRGTLGPLLGVNTAPADLIAPANRNDGSYYATSYAHALAGGTSYRPKMKFLFKVEFIFTPEAIKSYPEVFQGSKSNDFTFMVKSVDRPKIDFEYEDDVNMYNFRTKVLKKIRHRELTVSFMDDTGNRVLNFFRGLMMMHSPITRRQILREGTNILPNSSSLNSSNGMAFQENGSADNAIRGVTNSEVGNLIDTIRVKQFYVDSGAPIGDASKEVIFDFINARLVSFDLDELSHETNDVNVMTMQFDYDWMEIVEAGSLKRMDSPTYNITVPGVGGAPVDMSPSGLAGNSPGSGNTFGAILSNQLGRAAQQLTSDAVSRGVTAIAGKGRFASLINSQVSNIAGGLVGSAARDLTSGNSNVINQSTARSYSTNVIDSARGPATVQGVTRSNDDPLGAFISNPQAGF